MSLDTLARALRRALTEDHTPWANRYVYWIKTPLGVLIFATIAACLCGIAVAPQGFALAAVGVATIALGILWPWLGMRGIDANLRFEKELVREEEPVEVRFEIVNRWPFPVWGLFLAGEELSGLSSEQDGPTLAVSAVSGWSKMIVKTSWTPTVRGVYPAKSLAIRTAFPFGLWTCGKPVSVETPLHVAPSTMMLAPCPLPDGASWTQADPSSKAGDEGERESVRPYRRGDSLKQIHWSLTAKHDRFVVCERQSPAAARATVAIDPQALNWETTGRDSAREWSLRIACSAAEMLLRQNATVDFFLGDEASFTLRPGRSLTGFYKSLAAWKPCCRGSRASARSQRSREASSKDSMSLQIGLRSEERLPSRSRRGSGFDVVLSEDQATDREPSSTAVGARCLSVIGLPELQERFPQAWSRLMQESWRHA